MNSVQPKVLEVFPDPKREGMEKASVDDLGFSKDITAGDKDPRTENKMVPKESQNRQEIRSEISKKKSVSARQFLMTFRERPDDIYLMNKYSLNPKQLKKVYKALIEKGWLEEYEYHTRDRKTPELEEPTVNFGDTSTNVTVEGSFTDETLKLYRSQSRLNSEELDGQGKALGMLPPNYRPEQESSCSSSTNGRVNLTQNDDICPNCGREKHPSSPDSCVLCGIVFSKYVAIRKQTGVPIWDLDSEL